MTWDDPGGKYVREKSKSAGEKCVSDNSTGGKSGVTQTSRTEHCQPIRDVKNRNVVILR